MQFQFLAILKILFGLFLIAHGLVHAGLAAAPVPNDPSSRPGSFFIAPGRSWLLPRLGLSAPAGRWIVIALIALATLGFSLAGLSLLAGWGAAWRPLAEASAVISLTLLAICWHPWLVLGVLLDVAIFYFAAAHIAPGLFP